MLTTVVVPGGGDGRVALPDADARDRILRALDTTLFVEAGAGSGKTSALVSRVVALVMRGEVAVRNIAAVTFTDKAAAELRDRLRGAFEQAAADAEVAAPAGAPVTAQAAQVTAQEALDDLDAAAIGTLHSFAQRILSEHPIEAGLPPLIEISDEVASQVAFEERWRSLRGALLSEPDTGRAVLLGLAAGLKLEYLRSIALIFNGEWDRLESAVLAAAAPAVPDIDIAPLLAQTRELLDLESRCVDRDDGFLAQLAVLAGWRDRLAAAPDDAARLEVLAEGARLTYRNGRKPNWPGCDLAAAKTRLKALRDRCAAIRDETLDAVLRIVGHRIAEATIEAARLRRLEGSLEFHDLLVLARQVLGDPVHGEAVRARLHQRYRRLLLDEFQDTDPIQVELAVRIAAGAPATGARWQDVAVPPGRLFVVGDPKQSIYRFRRADIAMYLQAQSSLGDAVRLTTNFRTTPGVLSWINATFQRLIIAAEGSQPGFHGLDPHRPDLPGSTAVAALGVTAHPPGTGADAVRTAEAADVAAAVRTALAERWQIEDRRDGRPRDVELGDIAVLVPARTCLPYLQEALDRAGIPFRAEASSLVYRTSEVRDLLMAARTVDDPSDGLALISTLRSAVFGCGDDDLLSWKRAGGSFNILAPPDQDVLTHLPPGHPVAEGIAYLRSLHDQHTWLAPSELLDRIVRDRRMLEVAGQVRGGAGSRTRDVWRRLRFVIDHARAWSESERGGLRGYLAWASRQGDESSRVAEAILPETDAEAVRIMTIHAAKGLEFPVVVLTGLSSRPLTSRGVEVLWPSAGGYAVKVGAALQTGDFELAKPLDEQMGHHERIRLLYVGATRARDHLVVSFHRVARQSLATAQAQTSAELLIDACRSGPPMREIVAAGLSPVPAGDPLRSGAGLEPLARWQARVTASRTAASRRSAVSASSLEGSGGTDPGLAKGARDLELPPWNKGRYGTAIGRAVHGALQTVDLATGAGLEQAVSAQVLAEGVLPHAEVVLALCRSALVSATVRRAATRPHWRETYVGTPAANGRFAQLLPALDGERGIPARPAGEAHAVAVGAVLEGYIDLLYRQDDGSLVIVDYKTDAVPARALPSRVAHYRPQMQAYGLALSEALGEPVSQAVLLFLHPQGAFEEPVALSPGGLNGVVASAPVRRIVTHNDERSG